MILEIAEQSIVLPYYQSVLSGFLIQLATHDIETPLHIVVPMVATARESLCRELLTGLGLAFPYSITNSPPWYKGEFSPLYERGDHLSL